MAATVERGEESVPPEQVERLLQFRSRHPCKRIEVTGASWEYISCGEGTEALLVLPGGLRVAEAAFPYIQMFGDTYRVIVPTYPTLRSMAKVTDGIVAILDAEQVPEAFVLGQSYGGAVAQVLVQRHPSRVKKLVLSGSAPLIPVGWKKLLNDVLLPIATMLPEVVVMPLFKRIIAPLITVSGSERDFWEAYLDELFEQRLTKADLLSHLHTTHDAQTKYVYREGVQSDWRGDVLVIWGEHDHLRTERARRGMLAIYPQAQIHILAQSGHVAVLSEPEKYAARVRGFLEEGPLPPTLEVKAHDMKGSWKP
jgi:pimeloyl-ACP methyl ester carboxylesterase